MLNFGVFHIKETRMLKLKAIMLAGQDEKLDLCRYDIFLANNSSNFKVTISHVLPTPLIFLSSLCFFFKGSLEHCPTKPLPFHQKSMPPLNSIINPHAPFMFIPHLHDQTIKCISLPLCESQIPPPWETAKPLMNGHTHQKER